MSRAICIIIYIVNAINAFSQKKKKLFPLILYLLMFMMFSFVTTPTYQHDGYFRGDNEIYENQYNQLKDATFEEAFSGKYSVDPKTIGYTFITWEYARMGVPFSGFMASVFVFCSFMCYLTFKEISNNYSYFLILYFGYYFLYDIQQIRNFIGVSIILFAVKKLKDGKKILYCVLTFIATTIHTSMIVFLVFIIAESKSALKHKKTFIKIIGFIMFFLVGSNFIGLNIVKKVASLLFSSGYLSDKFNPFRPLIEVAMFLCYTKIVGEVYKSTNDEWASFIYRLNVISLSFLPLIMISMTMDRLLRPILLLDYILFSKYNSSILHKGSVIYISRNLISIVKIIVMTSLMTFFFSKTLFVWIFDSNTFLQWLGA